MSSSILESRKGRHQQRYENKLRLVAGCIPYKIDAKADDSTFENLIDRVQVLMISSPGRNDLIFPKGGWEQDETAPQAACREALEEAGVKGIISGTELGFWEFRSKSSVSSESSCSPDGACKGCLFTLQVTEELDFWPEQNTHARQWVSNPTLNPTIKNTSGRSIRALSLRLDARCTVEIQRSALGTEYIICF